MQGSPSAPLNSNSSSVSDPSAPWHLSEELDSGANQAHYALENGPAGDVIQCHLFNVFVGHIMMQ